MTTSTTAALRRGPPLSASLPAALGAYRRHTDDVAFFERGTLRATRELDTDHPPARAALLGWRTEDGDIQWDLHVCGVAWFAAVTAELSTIPAPPMPLPAATPTPTLATATPGYIPLDEAASKLGISRDRLDKMIAAVPADLPGTPVNFGSAKKKLLKFRADLLDEWVTAYRERTRPPPTAPQPASRRRKTSPKVPGGDGTGKITHFEVERQRRGK